MDPRLEEACYTAKQDMLHSLLREDKLLLHRLSSSSSTASIDNPLHIAASLGYADIANELIIRNPGLASDLNPRGLPALKLHLKIIKLLISKVGSHFCSLKDKNERLAIHIAAMKGRIDILEELIQVCPQSARAVTYKKESLLHLVTQCNSVETLEFLVRKLEVDDNINELLNLKDHKGNTILHHSVARRQLQSVKLLLSKGERVEVNAMNHKGLTALDVLLDSPREHGDLILGEVIRAAGGKMASEMDPHQPSLQTNTSISNEPSTTSTTTTTRSWRQRRTYSKLQQKAKKQNKVEDSYTPGQLMVVATLIATITFQSGLNPPGGFTQLDNPNETNITGSGNSSISAGVAVLGSNLSMFLLLDMIGLFASLSIILILICVVPRRKKMMMKILVVIMWLAVFSTGLTFSAGIYRIFPDSNQKKKDILLSGWFLILRLFILWVCMQFAVYLLRKVGWWRKKEGDK
ncbi:26S proteasome regulatory complex subunit PSMD10 protein [Dioscorea alata]|uniref:26S proteasome regulatory complex subunit PSMD10 protein n=1 Tax=Dioscorea alata TaxID=55571 RepID=A0ACB7WRX5_DIOAL|nr:26S proteasome regulatory complex subunit PSMD10 protein [Dioscorea alata]